MCSNGFIAQQTVVAENNHAAISMLSVNVNSTASFVVYDACLASKNTDQRLPNKQLNKKFSHNE